ncbi:ATP-dependent RNA helicase [Dimargaris verticillata]|uniref:RNA helicase n=1 Tax=Dimargaris verticillata TaxID=2761393 RepID=A0A9W8ECM8_9FUNG|nr:ATP-dependent RNA helicase [Dimargaris verticillata]
MATVTMGKAPLPGFPVTYSKKGRRDHAPKRHETSRRQLPIYSARSAIVDAIRCSPTVVIVGETGSGKTTQIPQYLFEEGLAHQKAIAVTQPRRVAAVSLARRVSEEVGTPLGRKVGYTVRFDDKSSNATRIKYLTDGMLIRELLSDKLLSRYNCVILDEAHERTLRTDILFGMLKDIQKQRQQMAAAAMDPSLLVEQSATTPPRVRELKIVVMSATLDAERFSAYFNHAQILYIAGRQYPVRIFNTLEPQSDYLDAAMITTLQIHTEEPPGDILLFLAGQEDIESLERLLNGSRDKFGPDALDLQVCPLYAALPPAQQAQAFAPAPSGSRKVILATNIAETSITLPGIRYVVDTGVHKVRGYNSKIGIESLLVSPVSKSSARQRTGRAGREAPGFCYRLYTEPSFDKLEEDSVPEILRCNLAAAVLQLKAAGVNDVLGFDYMDRPPKLALLRALEQLYALGALNDQGNLTDLGKWMAEFPLDPCYSKVLYQSQVFQCTSEVIDVIALLSVDTLFFSPMDKRDQAAEAHKKFVSTEGDHLTYLNLQKAYLETQGSHVWCHENFINHRGMKYVQDVRKQLRRVCSRVKVDPNTSCGVDVDKVLQCFVTGFFHHTALLQPDGNYKSVIGSQIVYIHPSSSMFGKRHEAIIYNELVFTSRLFIRGVSAIQANWIPESAPGYLNRMVDRQ